MRDCAVSHRPWSHSLMSQTAAFRQWCIRHEGRDGRVRAAVDRIRLTCRCTPLRDGRLVHDFADQVAVVSVAQDERLIGRDARVIVCISPSAHHRSMAIPGDDRAAAVHQLMQIAGRLFGAKLARRAVPHDSTNGNSENRPHRQPVHSRLPRVARAREHHRHGRIAGADRTKTIRAATDDARGRSTGSRVIHSGRVQPRGAGDEESLDVRRQIHFAAWLGRPRSLRAALFLHLVRRSACGGDFFSKLFFKHRYAVRTPIARAAMAIPSSSRHRLLRSR